MLGIVAILASLTLLMLLAYRGASVIALAPVCLLLAVAADPGTPLLAGYTQVFMPGVGRFIAQYFPLFLLGAVFGRLMEASGSARRIAVFITELLGAERAVLAVVLTCAVLTGGGVSLFVVVFAVQPIADYLFRRADVPRRLIPAAIALGSGDSAVTQSDTDAVVWYDGVCSGGARFGGIGGDVCGGHVVAGSSGACCAGAG
jgi:H+/gluconate symporter-like permease